MRLFTAMRFWWRREVQRWLDRRRGIIYRTKTGKALRDADIQALADEAELGYDVSHLRKREES